MCAKALNRIGRGEVASPGRRTVSSYLSDWLAAVKPTLETPAWTNYRSLIDLYVTPRIGAMQLAAITASTLNALHGDLLAGGGKRGQPLSPTTVRLVHRILHKAFHDAVDSGLLPVNPATRAKAPKRRPPLLQLWNASQAGSFLTTAASDRLYAAWVLALTCGLRRGEIAGLFWVNLDLTAGTLSVVTQRTTDADWNVVVRDPKGHQPAHHRPRTGRGRGLKAHRRQQAAERPAWGPGYADSGHVFLPRGRRAIAPPAAHRPVPGPRP